MATSQKLLLGNCTHDASQIKLGDTICYEYKNSKFEDNKTAKTYGLTSLIDGSPMGLSMAQMVVDVGKFGTRIKLVLPSSDYTDALQQAFKKLADDLSSGDFVIQTFKGLAFDRLPIARTENGDYEISLKVPDKPKITAVYSNKAEKTLCPDDNYGELSSNAGGKGAFVKRTVNWLAKVAGSGLERMAKIGVKVHPYNYAGTVGISLSATDIFVFAKPAVEVPAFLTVEILVESQYNALVSGETMRHAGKQIMWPQETSSERRNIPDKIELERQNGGTASKDMFMKCGPPSTEHSLLVYKTPATARVYSQFGDDVVRLGGIKTVKMNVAYANNTKEENPEANFTEEDLANISGHTELEEKVNDAMFANRRNLFSYDDGNGKGIAVEDVENIPMENFKEYNEDADIGEVVLLGKRQPCMRIEKKEADNRLGEGKTLHQSARMKLIVLPWCKTVLITADGDRIVDAEYIIPPEMKLKTKLVVAHLAAYATSEKGFAAKSQRIKMCGMKAEVSCLVLQEERKNGNGVEDEIIEPFLTTHNGEVIEYMAASDDSDDEEEEPAAKRVKVEKEDNDFIGASNHGMPAF
jgi:hypothetical protein